VLLSVPMGTCLFWKKVGYDHAKAVVQLDFVFSANDIRNSSDEATTLGGKFYSEV
jgi:hypothetical protein